MSIQPITEQELAKNGVSSLPLIPTASPAFGGRDYTPVEVKAAFDRLPRLIAARLNALLAAVTDGALLADIPVAFGDANLPLSELLELLGDHLKNPPVPDSAPASESDNAVSSGGVYAALAALRLEIQNAIAAAVSAQRLRYDAATGKVSLAQGADASAFSETALPIPALQETVALLRTLLGASVLSETVSDAYNTRVTADGLPVVDEAPTTVHKIVGATQGTEAGITSAAFAGLVSTGRNLLHFDTSDSARLYIDLSNPLFRVGNGVKILADRKMKVVKVFRYQGSQDWGNVIFGADFSATPVASKTFIVKNDPNLAYQYVFQIKFEDSAGYWAAREEVLNANLMLVPSDSTLTIDDYTPYCADTSFALASPVTLGRWDYLDVDDQKAVYQTAAVDFSEAVLSGENGKGRKYFKITPDQAIGTDFSADALITNLNFADNYWEKESDENAYIGWDGNYYFLTLMIPASYGENVSGWLQDNPQVYATYKLRVPATTQTVSVPHTYQAWHGGCEYMISDADGAQNPTSLELTVTQDYYVKAGGESA